MRYSTRNITFENESKTRSDGSYKIIRHDVALLRVGNRRESVQHERACSMGLWTEGVNVLNMQVRTAVCCVLKCLRKNCTLRILRKEIISIWRLRCKWYNNVKFSADKKNQLDVTFCILYFSSNSCSTCFGQPCAHHQELSTAWCYSLVLVCAVAAGRLSSPVGR